jgi:hypothetical protein
MSRPYVGDLGSGRAIVIGQLPCSCGLNASGFGLGALRLNPKPAITISSTYWVIALPPVLFEHVIRV